MILRRYYRGKATSHTVVRVKFEGGPHDSASPFSSINEVNRVAGTLYGGLGNLVGIGVVRSLGSCYCLGGRRGLLKPVRMRSSWVGFEEYRRYVASAPLFVKSVSLPIRKDY